MVRTDLEQSLHRLANYVECQLVDLVHLCVAEGRIEVVPPIAWSAGRFVESLRELRDGKERGEV